MDGFFKPDPLANVLAANRAKLNANKAQKRADQVEERAALLEQKLRGAVAVIRAEQLLVGEIMDEVEGNKPARLSLRKNKALRDEFRDQEYKKYIEKIKNTPATDL